MSPSKQTLLDNPEHSNQHPGFPSPARVSAAPPPPPELLREADELGVNPSLVSQIWPDAYQAACTTPGVRNRVAWSTKRALAKLSEHPREDLTATETIVIPECHYECTSAGWREAPDGSGWYRCDHRGGLRAALPPESTPNTTRTIPEVTRATPEQIRRILDGINNFKRTTRPKVVSQQYAVNDPRSKEQAMP